MDPLSERAVRAEAEALLLLQQLPGLGDLGTRKLIRTFGSARAALSAPDLDFAAVIARGEPGATQLALARARAIA